VRWSVVAVTDSAATTVAMVLPSTEIFAVVSDDPSAPAVAAVI